MPENGVLRKDFSATDDLPTGETAGALKQDERQYRRIVENAPVGIVQTTPEGRIITANPALARILGYGSVDELLRTAPGMVSHCAAVADHRELLRQLQQHGAVVDYEIQMRRKNGNLIWVSVDIQVVRDEHGVHHYQGAVEDVTDRKRAEEEVWEAASRAWRRRRITVAVELAIIGGLTALVYAGAARFDWFEVVTVWLQANRTLQQLDELVLAAVFLVVGLLVFAFRRWRESESEVTSQHRVEEAMRLLHDELDVRVKLRTAELREANDALRAEAVERTRTEAALRESEERFRAIADYTMDWENWIGPDGKLLWVNPAVERVTGYSVAEFRAMHTLSMPLSAEEDREVVRGQFQRAMAGTRESDQEFRFVHKDGTTRWGSVAWQPIYASDGTHLGHRSSVRDITERKRTETALRESEERFRRLSEAAFEAIALHEGGVVVSANDQYFEMFGYEPDELLGKQVMLLTVAPEAREFMRQQIATGGLGPYESIGLRKDGTKFPMEIRVREMEYQGRKIRVGAIMDLTERKRTEEALRRSETKFRTLYDSTSDAVMLLDAKGFFDCNQATLTMFGCATREEFCSKHPADVSPPTQPCGTDSLTLANRRIATAMEQGSHHFEWMHRRADTDETFPVEVLLSAMELDGKRALQAVVRNIAARKRAEVELRTSREQMRALAARLQTMREEERIRVAREIHDVLAQELTRLKIDLVWLQRRLAKPGQAAATEGLVARVAEMSQMADTAIHTVQRIATELRPAVLDSLGLCAAVEWQARDFQTHAKIQCHASVPEEELPVDRDAATATFRILQESLTNVQRHAHATRVEVSLRQEAGQLILRVEDNGRGILAETLSNPMSIGLAGMRERALLLGGQLEIRGGPGSGTTVEMRLPLAKNDSPPIQAS